MKPEKIWKYFFGIPEIGDILIHRDGNRYKIVKIIDNDYPYGTIPLTVKDPAIWWWSPNYLRTHFTIERCEKYAKEN